MKQKYGWLGLGIAATAAMFPVNGTPAAARFLDRGLPIAQLLNQPKVELQLIVKQKVTQKDTQGKEQLSWNVLTKDTTVQKGTLLRLQVIAKNNGDRAAEKLAVTRPIPKGTTYAIGSATQSDAELSYSIDGGKTFTGNPVVRAILPDGRVEMQPAPAQAYTHVRWSFSQSVAPKSRVEIAYDVTVL